MSKASVFEAIFILERVRIDKWLWAARFYKTRQLAIKALRNSQILSRRQKLKPASLVTVGDVISIERGLLTIEVRVLQLSEKRGPAKVAQTLYEETAESMAARAKLKTVLDSQPRIDFDRRKPDRRALRSQRAAKRVSEE